MQGKGCFFFTETIRNYISDFLIVFHVGIIFFLGVVMKSLKVSSL